MRVADRADLDQHSESEALDLFISFFFFGQKMLQKDEDTLSNDSLFP